MGWSRKKRSSASASAQAKLQPRNPDGTFRSYKKSPLPKLPDCQNFLEQTIRGSKLSGEQAKAVTEQWFQQANKPDNLGTVPEKVVRTTGELLSNLKREDRVSACEAISEVPSLVDVATAAHTALADAPKVGIEAYKEFVRDISEALVDSDEQGLEVIEPDMRGQNPAEAPLLTVDEIFGLLDDNPEGMTASPFADATDSDRHSYEGVAVAVLGSDTVIGDHDAPDREKNMQIWLDRLEPAFRTGLLHLGGWHNQALNRYEISATLVIDNVIQANLLGMLSNQIGTYDLG